VEALMITDRSSMKWCYSRWHNSLTANRSLSSFEVWFYTSNRL